ncbi:AbrB/MazE/SpoVT family DNA-binding domain-containing protein [Paraburkholderia sp.]|uniref:AbrB/MazE/SpoVT family DNA-binding domain-containing protein n=1 Tax=Paraburkholderia sp. TaxID=1926495 RepID=UPI00239FDCFF|nr:AbrB/MazE/SpoVT family DNA-binding domain-containing protein [Paraburkholderia sp.]MDE1183485.1 AbrB/MazE/SpoVT family DNA-binding domain-containing protein [Paraburkholderia sp.]
MKLQVAKWGNSLALRLPAEFVRRPDIKEGDSVQANLTVDGGIHIRSAEWNRGVFAQELETVRAAMPMTEPVVEVMRQGERY